MRGLPQGFEPKSRAEVLAFKRGVSESRLAFALSVGDATLARVARAQLARIAGWERSS